MFLSILNSHLFPPTKKQQHRVVLVFLLSFLPLKAYLSYGSLPGWTCTETCRDLRHIFKIHFPSQSLSKQQGCMWSRDHQEQKEESFQLQILICHSSKLLLCLFFKRILENISNQEKTHNTLPVHTFVCKALRAWLTLKNALQLWVDN